MLFQNRGSESDSDSDLELETDEEVVIDTNNLEAEFSNEPILQTSSLLSIQVSICLMMHSADHLGRKLL